MYMCNLINTHTNTHTRDRTEIFILTLFLLATACCVVLVFKQSGKLTFTDPRQGLTATGRGGTNTRDLIAKYNLGNPVAGNFYQAEWDDYVPKLYAKLGL